jgi:hypothetical protein
LISAFGGLLVSGDINSLCVVHWYKTAAASTIKNM